MKQLTCRATVCEDGAGPLPSRVDETMPYMSRRQGTPQRRWRPHGIAPGFRAGLGRRLRSKLLWALVAVSALYLSTQFPGVGGRVNVGDSAKFQFLGAIGGIGHPPGSPLYLVLNALWVHLPWPSATTTAQRVTLLSSVFALVTLGLLASALSRSIGARAALAGVIALAIGPQFWTLATEAELYTLNTALVAASCAAAMRFERTQERSALLSCAVFALFGCANHMTSVLLLPGVAYLIWTTRRTNARLRMRELSLLLTAAVASAGLYAYIPVRSLQGAAYSEWGGTPSVTGFWKYVSATQFQAGLSVPSWDKLVRVRLPGFASQLQKQWAWPVLLLLPLGFRRLRERARLTTRFVQLALCGFGLFALLYDIPDPDGFYLPIATLLSVPLGLACTSREGRWSLRLGLLAVCLSAAAMAHLQHVRKLVGTELVYSLGNHKYVAWDLGEVFARVPEGARFAQPCSAYGCVQIINYHRFADPTVQARNIRFVQLPGASSFYYAFAPMPALPWEAGQREVICTLRKADAKKLAQHGARLRTIDRAARRIADTEYKGVPIYCTDPT